MAGHSEGCVSIYLQLPGVFDGQESGWGGKPPGLLKPLPTPALVSDNHGFYYLSPALQGKNGDLGGCGFFFKTSSLCAVRWITLS